MRPCPHLEGNQQPRMRTAQAQAAQAQAAQALTFLLAQHTQDMPQLILKEHQGT